MNVSRTVEIVDAIQSCSLEDLQFLLAYIQLKVNKSSSSSTPSLPPRDARLIESSEYIPTVLLFDTPKTEATVKQPKWSEVVATPVMSTSGESVTPSEKPQSKPDSRCTVMVRGWDPSLYPWQDVRKFFTSTIEAPLGLMSVYVNKKGYATLKFTGTRDAEKAWKILESSNHFGCKLQIKWNK